MQASLDGAQGLPMIPLLFALTLAASEPQITVAPQAPPKPETAKERRRREKLYAQNKIVCRDMTPTGTNFSQNVCQTQAEWDKIRQQALEDAKMIYDVSRDMPRNPTR